MNSSTDFNIGYRSESRARAEENLRHILGLSELKGHRNHSKKRSNFSYSKSRKKNIKKFSKNEERKKNAQNDINSTTS